MCRAVILVIVAIGGCRPAEMPDDGFPLAVARAAVAFAEAEIERSPVATPAASPNNEPPSAAIRKRRVLYFTAEWCVACRGNQATLAALAARGWQIESGERGHIQTVDVDQRPDLARHYAVTVVPTWLLIDDGVECRRRHGVLDPFDVGRLFDE